MRLEQTGRLSPIVAAQSLANGERPEALPRHQRRGKRTIFDQPAHAVEALESVERTRRYHKLLLEQAGRLHRKPVAVAVQIDLCVGYIGRNCQP